MLPKLVMFDYGETLAHEDDYRARDGFAAILPYAAENPMGADADILFMEFRSAYFDLRREAHSIGLEMPNIRRWQWLFDIYGLKFSRSMETLESIFWNAAAPCVPTPNAEKLLALLREKDIKTGVISNMGFSGNALKKRLKGLFPEHEFDFVISSADYILRKPNGRIFALGLRLADCRAEDAWFLGDNLRCDIRGAADAGIHPVYYDRDLGCAYRENEKIAVMPACTRVNDWNELIEIIEKG